MFSGLPYGTSGLDRLPHLRRDPAWVAAQRASPGCRIVPVWRDRNLFVAPSHSERAYDLAVADPGDAARLFGDGGAQALLGIDATSRPWFAVDLSAWDEAAVVGLVPGARLADLRRMSAALATAVAGILAYARGLLYWHRRHRFCGACGAPTEDREAGFLRLCTNPDCGATHFPRTDPAVIMLVTRPGPAGGACLLGRQARWPRGMYSTLAGFVEPGESLEGAVVREVAEEAGVPVHDVRYRGSQAWPFPSSLMLGFRAAAPAAAPLIIDPDELEDAAWFTRTDLAAFREQGRSLPRGDSIARRLVEEWLSEES